MNKIELKKDLSLFIENKQVKFKKGEILILDKTIYRALDGRSFDQENIKFYSTHFKIIK